MVHETAGYAFSYGLRERQSRAGWAAREDSTHPAAEAVIAAGCRPRTLSKAEQSKFSAFATSYIDARNFILSSWYKSVNHALTEKECTSLGLKEGLSPARIKDAFGFLDRQGLINFGLLSAQTGGKPNAVTEETVSCALYELLSEADMEMVTEKKLRKQLAEKLSADMAPFKNFIRNLINTYLESGGPPAEFRAQKETAAKERKKRVIVIGGGPAGLVAASHLQRHNVDVTVLEARRRVGGRVHSFRGQDLHAPVDLGASIITGISPDVSKGHQPDPASILFRQLGKPLHTLAPHLPLFCDGPDPIDSEVDSRVEDLQNQLMDDVAARLAGMPASEAEWLSYGQLLEEELAKREIKESMVVEKPVERARFGAEDNSRPEIVTSPEADVVACLQSIVDAVCAPEEGTGEADQEGNASRTAGDAPAMVKPCTTELESASSIPELDRRVLQWHWANLEYGCSASLSQISALHWNQDEEFGGFGGPHAMVPGGLDSAFRALAETVQDLRIGARVSAIESLSEAENGDGVAVTYTTVEKEEVAEVSTKEAPSSSMLGTATSEEEGPQRRAESSAEVNNDEASIVLIELGTAASSEAPQHKVQQQGKEDTGTVAEAEPALETRIRTVVRRELADAVIVTVPLGVLKAGAIEFSPELPSWKSDAIQRLGFGCLNKVVLQFPRVFWDMSLDYFGAVAPAGEASRGRYFMFWNLARHNGGVPILVALVSGTAARNLEQREEEEERARNDTKPVFESSAELVVTTTNISSNRTVQGAVEALRALFQDDTIVPDPETAVITRWGADPSSLGSYSFVAVGSTGRDYDTLALPVRRRVLFAGEHTARAHPDTVGGAMLSGLREAVRALNVLEGKDDEALSGARRDGSDLEEEEEIARARKRLRENDDLTYDEVAEEEGRRQLALALGHDVARREEQLRLREAARQEHKALWRAVLLAGSSGDASELVEQIRTAEGTNSKLSLVQVLRNADEEPRKALAARADALRLLRSSYAERALERVVRDGVPLLEATLRLLAALPVADASLLRESGLTEWLRETKLRRHSNDTIARAATALYTAWGPILFDSSKKKATSAQIPKSADFHSMAILRPPKLDSEALAALERAKQEAESAAAAAAALAARTAELAAAAENNNKEDAGSRKGTAEAALQTFDDYYAGKRPDKKRARDERSSSSRPEPQDVPAVVESVLKPLFKKGHISKDQYKAVARKAVARLAKEPVSQGQVALNEKRRAKIVDLVNKYLDRLRSGGSL